MRGLLIVGGVASTETLGGRGSTDLAEQPWRLHPSVAIRPEPFGALLYHYGTRRLTFVKDPTLVAVLRALDASPDARAALDAAGVAAAERPRFVAALRRLASTQMLVAGDRGEGT